MRLLLDTHIWLDCATRPARLGRRLMREIQARQSELWLSPVSVWEMLKLAEKGRLRTPASPAQLVERLVRALPLKEAPITIEIARETALFVLPHRDPADAWLVATARVRGFVLATRDEGIINSGVVDTLADD